MKPTDGKWFIDDRIRFAVNSSSGKHVAMVNLDACVPEAEALANARLICEAKEMYEALQECLKLINQLIPYAGEMPQPDYALLNNAPLQARLILKRLREGDCDEP